MGIKGLWKVLKPYVRDGHLSHFRDQRVAVDIYVWLHRSLKGCVNINHERLLAYLEAKYASHDNQGDSTHEGVSRETLYPAMEDIVIVDDRYIDYVVSKVDQLRRNGIVPVCVFDGAEMPMKQSTDESRLERREKAFAEALRLLEEQYICDGYALNPRSSAYIEARQCLERTVDISTELAYAVLQVLREEQHVECIVAPYEADAQLAYMCREGYVQAAVSEDSDLIAYYCPCIIAKLDSYGACEVLRPAECAPHFFAMMRASSLSGRKRLTADWHEGGSGNGSDGVAVAAPTALSANHRYQQAVQPFSSGAEAAAVAASPVVSASPSAFTYESFLLACVLSGCDYVPNLRSIGVMTAFKLVASANTLPQLLSVLHTQYGFPEDELKRYRRAILAAFYCFGHHIVYCPFRKCTVHYHPLPSPPAGTGTATTTAATAATSLVRTDLIGFPLPRDIAVRVCAECLLDPCTKQLYEGTYRHCVEGYLRRTRKGQSSLRAFSGFAQLSAPKVVFHLDDGKRQSEGGPARVSVKKEVEVGAESIFGSPLVKVRQASGFCAGSTAAGSASFSDKKKTIIRSKHFLRGCVVVDRSLCLDSDDPDDTQGAEEKETLTPATGSSSSREIANSQLSVSSGSPSRYSSSSLSAAHTLLSHHPKQTSLPASSPCSHTACDSGEATADDAASFSSTAGMTVMARCDDTGVIGEAEVEEGDGFLPSWQRLRTDTNSEFSSCATTGAAATTATSSHTERSLDEAEGGVCPCPFSYWQCGKSHSVFIQCFEGKRWVRGEHCSPGVTSAKYNAVATAVEGIKKDTSASTALPTHCMTATTTSSQSNHNHQHISAGSMMARTGGMGKYTSTGFRPPRPLSSSSSSTLSGSTNSLHDTQCSPNAGENDDCDTASISDSKEAIKSSQNFGASGTDSAASPSLQPLKPSDEVSSSPYASRRRDRAAMQQDNASSLASSAEDSKSKINVFEALAFKRRHAFS